MKTASSPGIKGYVSTLSLLLVISLCACGEKSPPKPGSAPPGAGFLVDEKARAEHGEASELFRRYLEGRPAASAKNCAIEAFQKWGRVPGSVGYVEEALKKIAVTDDLWGKIIDYVYTAYCNEYRKKDAIRLFEGLKNRVTSPRARQIMLFRTGRHRMLSGDRSGARACFQESIRLNADPFYTEHSRFHIYDMENLLIGRRAPDFRVTDIRGNPVTRKGLKGKYIILLFWNSYCAPCSRFISAVKNVQARRKDIPLAVIASGVHDSDIKLSVYAREQGLPWILVSEQNSLIRDINTKLMYAFNAHEIPYLCVIDPAGILRDKIYPDEEARPIEERLEKSLGPATP